MAPSTQMTSRIATIPTSRVVIQNDAQIKTIGPQCSHADRVNTNTKEKLQIMYETIIGTLANISKIDYDKIASNDNSATAPILT